jgi:rhodanese-related sulfurtransferase
MKNIVFGLLLVVSFAFSQVINFPISKNIVNSGIKIVDIRTKPEWLQTGIIKGSKTITFFDSMGRYDAAGFLKKIAALVKPGEKVALVCRTGHRSKIVAKFLSDKGYDVIDLLGGVQALAKDNYKFAKYEQNK